MKCGCNDIFCGIYSNENERPLSDIHKTSEIYITNNEGTYVTKEKNNCVNEEMRWGVACRVQMCVVVYVHPRNKNFEA